MSIASLVRVSAWLSFGAGAWVILSLCGRSFVGELAWVRMRFSAAGKPETNVPAAAANPPSFGTESAMATQSSPQLTLNE